VIRRVDRAVRSSFWRWLGRQNLEAQQALDGWVPALGAMAVVSVLSAGAAWLPAVKEFFGVRFLPSAAAFLPEFVLTIGWHGLRRTAHRPYEPSDWVVTLLVEPTLTLFWPAYMLAKSAVPGNQVFSVLFIAAGCYYMYLFKSGIRHPFLLLPVIVSGVMAMPFAREESAVLLAACILTTALLGVMMGTFAVIQQDTLRESQRLRDALHARMIDDKGRELAGVRHALVGVMGVNHDASNTLTAALLGAEALAERCRTEQAQLPPELPRMAQTLERDLSELKELIREVRTIGRSGAAPLEPVPLRTAIDASAEVVRRMHPRVAIRNEVDDVAVQVRGGGGNLRRILDNLLINACQGDGKTGAREVKVSGRRREDGAFELVVRDDGPGFPADLIGQPIEGFRTTKRGGTGLGLYTSESLVRASGGIIERRNAETGGAEVSVSLAVAA